MKPIVQSATKITLLWFVFVICITTLAVVFKNLGNESIIAWVFGIFTTSAWMVLGYYFRKAQEETPTTPIA
jgi:positive regulator of sigma E activity